MTYTLHFGRKDGLGYACTWLTVAPLVEEAALGGDTGWLATTRAVASVGCACGMSVVVGVSRVFVC